MKTKKTLMESTDLPKPGVFETWGDAALACAIALVVIVVLGWAAHVVTRIGG